MLISSQYLHLKEEASSSELVATKKYAKKFLRLNTLNYKDRFENDSISVNSNLLDKY